MAGSLGPLSRVSNSIYDRGTFLAFNLPKSPHFHACGFGDCVSTSGFERTHVCLHHGNVLSPTCDFPPKPDLGVVWAKIGCLHRCVFLKANASGSLVHCAFKCINNSPPSISEWPTASAETHRSPSTLAGRQPPTCLLPILTLLLQLSG